MGWLRDRRFRLAMELSLLLHLVLLFFPSGQLALTAVPAKLAQPLKEEEEKPLRFELVELPDQREETPSRADAPGSDLSRRAHGGTGAPADRPAVAGTSPELRWVPPSSQSSASPSVPPPPAPQEQAHADPHRSPAEGRELPPDAATALVVQPRQPESEPSAPTPPKVALRGLSPFSAPHLGVVPDRKGGQVDLGPLSFDTQWYDWGPYAAEMLRRIRYHWRIPELAQLGVPGVVRIRFFIERDGRVTGLTILKDSSHPPMDFAARDAILNASPLPPLPKEVGVEREGVIITFYYNVRPPEDV
ncbi:MAG: TonB C-terminal domain-containing protein [Thermoanaerobaculum sp.]|nr:TonB C-terminal domain-containing protein [Thermoanaerobaculum sp.]